MNDTNIQKDSMQDWLFGGFSEEELLVEDILSDISSTIQKERKEKGMTQKELAKALNVSQGIISRWENGEENLTISTLAKIAIGLGLKLTNPLHNYVESSFPKYERSIKMSTKAKQVKYKFMGSKEELKGVA